MTVLSKNHEAYCSNNLLYTYQGKYGYIENLLWKVNVRTIFYLLWRTNSFWLTNSIMVVLKRVRVVPRLTWSETAIELTFLEVNYHQLSSLFIIIIGHYWNPRVNDCRPRLLLTTFLTLPFRRHFPLFWPDTGCLILKCVN